MIPLVKKCEANLGRLKTATGRVLDGQFYWGGTLLKSNAGTQRLAYHGWKSWGKRKGLSQLDCDIEGWSRYESRS